MTGVDQSQGERRLTFLMIVDDVDIAKFVSRNGVDRLFVDLERNGKQERQGHLASWKSGQTIADVSKIRNAAPDAHLLVRINPVHEGTKREIDEVVERGVDSIMLPMFRTHDELKIFFDALAGRVPGVPLFETAASLNILTDGFQDLPLERAHIGLNDLHLDMANDFMFEPIANGVLEAPCAALRDAHVRFGIGGVARSGEGILSPEYLLGEHVRLGSSGAILSRTFHRNATTLEELTGSTDFKIETDRLRAIYADFLSADHEALERNRKLTADRIRDVATLVRAKREETA